MSPHALAFTMACLLFLLLLAPGREREVLRRCVVCGARKGEKHHDDCHWRQH